MKIDSSVGRVVGSGPLNTVQERSKTPARSTGQESTQRDSVDITGAGAQMRELDKIDVVDASRVSAVRQAIQDGSFEVNSEVVAERLIQSNLETLRTQAQK